MKRTLALLVVLPAAALAPAQPAAGQSCECAAAPSWIFRMSNYSHDPMTGERVNQFQPEKPAYAPYDPTYLQSGYRHNHTALPTGDGGWDHTHIVETWGLGDQIRPYGEWQYPYRPGATPFGWGYPGGPWGSPYESGINGYFPGQMPGYPGSTPYGGGYPPQSAAPFFGPYNGGGYQPPNAAPFNGPYNGGAGQASTGMAPYSPNGGSYAPNGGPNPPQATGPFNGPNSGGGGQPSPGIAPYSPYGGSYSPNGGFYQPQNGGNFNGPYNGGGGQFYGPYGGSGNQPSPGIAPWQSFNGPGGGGSRWAPGGPQSRAYRTQ
jgi:hypothetical protein